MDPKVDIGQCRFCSNEGIFSLNDTNEKYSDIILECFNIFISASQTTSSLICSECVTYMRDAYSFRQRVLHAEQSLLDGIIEVPLVPPDTKPVDIKVEPGSTKSEPLRETVEHHNSDKDELSTNSFRDQCIEKNQLGRSACSVAPALTEVHIQQYKAFVGVMQFQDDSSNESEEQIADTIGIASVGPLTSKRTNKVDIKSKRLKNFGEYTSEPCTCRFRCYNKISSSQCRILFENFWRLGNRHKQWIYLIKYARKAKKSRCTNTEVPNNRQFSFRYYLACTESDETQHTVVRVCKRMFTNTLAISDRMIRTAWLKYDGTEVEADKRGRHSKTKKRLK